MSARSIPPARKTLNAKTLRDAPVMRSGHATGEAETSTLAPITRACADLHTARVELADAVGLLTDRLTDVLRPDEDSEDDGKLAALRTIYSVPVADGIAEEARALRLITERVTDVISRLGI